MPLPKDTIDKMINKNFKNKMKFLFIIFLYQTITYYEYLTNYNNKAKVEKFSNWWAVLVMLQLPLQCQCSTLLLS